MRSADHPAVRFRRLLPCLILRQN